MTSPTPLRIGFIGSGGNARHHMGQMLSIPGVTVAAIADPNPAMVEAAHRQHASLAETPSFADYRQMLSSVPMDAVVISTPHTLHKEQILAALDAGVHVLCEKPLVCTVKDAQEVIAKRDAAGKVCLLSYQRHYQAEFRYIRARITSGELGAVTFVNALQCQNWKNGTRGTWRQDPALSGGGQLNDSGSHLVDIILWITGLEPETVSAFIDNCGTPVDINSALTVRFRNGAQGNISIVGDAVDWHEDVTIWCEKGFFLMRNGRLQVSDASGRCTFDQLRGGSNPDRAFVEAIRSGGPVDSPFECGLRVIELTEAAWRSAAEGGRPVTV